MTTEYKISTTTPSSPYILSRNENRFRSSYSDSKEVFSSSVSRWHLLRPLLYRVPAFSCSFFILLRVSIFFVATRLKLFILFTVSSFSLWHLTQSCFLPAPCRAANIFFASGKPQQYCATSENTFRSFRFPVSFQTHSQQTASVALKEMKLLRSAK